MPFTWRIDHERQLVVARADGRIVLDELQAYYSACFGSEETAGYDELGLATGAPAMDVDAAGFRAVMGSRGHHPSGRPARVAIVVDQDASYAAGRVGGAVMSEGDAVEMQVFRTLPSALEWLGLPEDFELGI